MLAGLRFGAGPEGLEDDVAVARRRQFAGAGVDAHQPYARRHAELDRRLALQRGAHEFLEDRHRDGGTLFVLAEAFRRVVAGEDADREVGAEADEPGVVAVVGGAGLAGERDAEFADAPAGAALPAALEDRDALI